jgi:glycine/D-amino acid oxidase-like deaminating enzyme
MDYLYEECQNTGVAFRFGQEINRIEKSMRGQLQAVDVGSSKPSNNNETNISCHNIIVAAGAQTPEALDDIITWLEPKTTFENHTESYEWVRAPMDKVLNGEELQDVSIVIRGGKNVTVKGKGRVDDSPSSAFSILTPDPETNTILAATIADPTSKPRFRVNPGADLSKSFNDAEQIARTYLKDGELIIPTAAAAIAAEAAKSESKTKSNSSSDSDSSNSTSSSASKSDPPPKTSGAATVSTSFSHAPLVTMIPWEIADPRVKDTVTEDETTKTKRIHQLGIYVAYGLGRHGTTLAPGVAKMVVSKVYGDAEKEVKDEDAGLLEAAGEAYGWPEGYEP